MVARAARCETRMLVPGACGFRYGPRSSWLNRIAFPVARSRFCGDVRRAMDAAETVIVEVDPGDEISCNEAGPAMHPRACDFVSSATDGQDLVAFCPVDPFQSLFREAPRIGVSEAGLSAVIEDLDAFIRTGLENPSSQLAAYAKWEVVYQLIVCLPRGNVFVNWDFSSGARRIDARSPMATATCIMAAGTGSWEEAYHSGQWRFFQSVALVSGTGYAVPADGEIQDVMQLRHPYEDALQRLISSEVARWSNVDDMSN
jgi:hypothetical protein